MILFECSHSWCTSPGRGDVSFLRSKLGCATSPNEVPKAEPERFALRACVLPASVWLGDFIAAVPSFSSYTTKTCDSLQVFTRRSLSRSVSISGCVDKRHQFDASSKGDSTTS